MSRYSCTNTHTHACAHTRAHTHTHTDRHTDNVLFPFQLSDVNECNMYTDYLVSIIICTYHILLIQLYVTDHVRMVGLAQHQIPALVPQSGLGLPVQHVSELEII